VFPHKSKFLKKPEDWKARRSGWAGDGSRNRKEVGSEPCVLASGELYIALQKGIIDGYMLIWDIINGLKLYEVAPFHVDSEFSNNVENVT